MTMTQAVQFALLSGLRVIDFTFDESLFCARTLLELGTDVVRVESNSGRYCSAHVWGSGNYGTMRLAFERDGGKIVELDQETPSGQDLIKELVVSADCLLESFRPGYLESIGLGYPILQSLNPRLIVVSITGFGQSGPRREWISCDLTLAALGGQMYVTGEVGKPPLKLYGYQVERLGVLFALNAMLLAVQQRHRTGRGQWVDISLMECVSATLDHVLPRYFGEGVVSGRQGSLAWSGNFKIVRCRDGYLLVSLPLNAELLVGVAQPREGRHSSSRVRPLRGESSADRTNPVVNVEIMLRDHTAEELFREAQLRRLPWGQVLNPSDLFENQQLLSRRFFKGIETEAGGTVKVPRALPFLTTVASKDVFDRHRDIAVAGSAMPLEGLRVLDFTWVMAGPYATRTLADFGAEVIKVQSRLVPGTEEVCRSAYFKYWNRGKLSITLNMNHPEGVGIARRLVKRSDVLIESFSPRVMENWGLDMETLWSDNPDLIVVSMSAFGRTGPWRNYVAFGPTVHALSGLTSSTKYRNGAPIGPGFAFADHVAGLYAVLATLAALEHRRRTGRGVYVDLSQYEATSILTLWGWKRDRVVAVPYGVYPCRDLDSWCAIAIFGDQEWRRFCEVAGMAHLSEVREFADVESRLRNRVKVDGLVADWTRNLTAGEVVVRLQEAGVCAGVVQSARDIANDEQLAARDFFVELVNGDGQRLVFDGTPIKLSEGRALCNRGAPTLGHDNDYVYCDLLGISPSELIKYVESRIIY